MIPTGKQARRKARRRSRGQAGVMGKLIRRAIQGAMHEHCMQQAWCMLTDEQRAQACKAAGITPPRPHPLTMFGGWFIIRPCLSAQRRALLDQQIETMVAPLLEQPQPESNPCR